MIRQLLTKFKYRKILLALADAFIIVIAALITNFLLVPLSFYLSREDLSVSMIVNVICGLLSLTAFGAYNKLWRYFHTKDYISCIFGVVTGVLVSSLLTKLLAGHFPLAYTVLHCCVIIIGICLFRFIFRTAFIDLVSLGRREASMQPTLIIGGGQACRAMLREIRNAQKSPYQNGNAMTQIDPVCILDDDRAKIGREIEGVQIVGTTAELARFVEESHPVQIIFCIPSCPEQERSAILAQCLKTGLPVKVIPLLGNVLFEEAHTTLLGQVRDIRVEDLLGREPVTFDMENIRHFISGKVCMVTGGGGSIGSELVRQIARYAPAQIIIVDIYENNAYEIQQELRMEYGDSLNLVTLIASVRDYYRMNQIFSRYKPQIVFHAAAHKHVPLMEAAPMEAIKNNVLGTFHTATLAQFHNAEKFVMISTDKAVNPTNVMGASKRCCEMIVQYLAQQQEGQTEFVTTRFGNVLGSNGSVIPLFRRQIEKGGPVTVTHPDVTRYFMTIPEAVSLVMEAAAIAHGGEIFVLDMGKPVRIVTLAENLIRMYGKVPNQDIEIRFTGLRPGEKIREELLMNEEGLQKTSNKLIFIGQQIDIDPDRFIHDLRRLKDAAIENDEQLAVEMLHKIVPTFVTPEEFNAKNTPASE